MSNFLSQLEINPQVAQNDDEEFQEEDIEREKEIKELLEHELNEDEFFEDDSSFASHQTSINSLIDPSFDYNQLPSLPNEVIRKDLPAPLLTSRGSEFISRISPRYDGKRDGEVSNRATHCNRVLDNSNKDVNQEEDAFAVLGYDGQDFSGKIDFSNEASNHIRSPYVDSYTKSLGQRHFFEGHEHFETMDNRSDERGSFKQNQQSSFIKDSFMRHFDDNTGNEDIRIHGVEGHVGRQLADLDYHRYSENQNQPLEEWQETRTEHYHENTPDNGTQSHDQSQLRILYEARGRKIESLQKELDVKTEDQAKEIRILQHKLSLAKGEQDGMSMTLQHSQDSLQEMKLEINALQRRLSEEAKNTKELVDERKELLHKLEIAESGMEALNQQIVAMNREDSLSKMRLQHETIMATLRQKHEEEILLLKEKLDDTKKELNWKTEDVNRLQDEMQSAKKYITQLKVESAETVNKLTESLEQSQHRLRGMLAEGSDNSNAENKVLLMQAKKENTNLLEENKSLKDEIRDVKEQLGLYEVALNSTIEGPSSSTPYNAHDVAQKLHQLDAFKTPLSRFAKDNRLKETNTNSIREDLIKALASNKTRREELNNAKMQINSLKEQLEEVSADKKRIQMMNEALKTENDAISVGLKDSNHQVSEEKPDANEKLSDLQQKLELSEAKVESLEKQLQQEQGENTVLKSEMAEMIRQFDKDKIDALKSCEKTYTKFNEDSKQHLEERLNSLHEQEITELKDEIKQLKRELLDVKDSYVSLANENRKISEQVRTECETENTLHLKELTEKLTEEHKEEVHKLEERMLGKSYTQVEELRKKLKEDFEEETKHRIETAVALAKVEWFASYEEERSDSIQRAVEAANMKFDRQRGLEEEKMIETLRFEWEKEKQEEYEKQLNSSIKRAREEWGEATRVETEKAIKEALENFKQEHQIQRLKELEEMANWETERNSLQQQILKEESVRIRTELLRGFAEEMSEMSDGENNIRVQDDSDRDVYSELKESIAYVKSVYEKKFNLQKVKYEDQVRKLEEWWQKEQIRVLDEQIKDCEVRLERKMNDEKEAALKELNENWEARLVDVKEKEAEHSKNGVERELEKAKGDWRKELGDLQKEHDLALKTAISDIRSKASTEKANLEKGFKEIVRRLKKENAEKLDKQKSELEEYHSALTEKTLKLARKEWELEYSFSSQGALKRRDKKALAESTQHHAQNHELDRNTDHSGNSDSGFTSPLSRVLPSTKTPTIQNSTEIGYNEGAEQSHVVMVAGSSPPYEMLLSKIEADMVTVRGNKTAASNAVAKRVFTQTDLTGMDNANALQEMRQYYLETVKKIKEDVSKHISKTKENASTRIRNEVAREKKQLINQIRKRYLKSLKAESVKGQSGRREVAILQILKEADSEGYGEADFTEDSKENMLRGKFSYPSSEVAQKPPSHVMTSGPTRPVGGPTPKMTGAVGGKRAPARGHKKDSSPNTSMFSCESNGTFYTELPSTFTATPSPEKVVKKCFR